MEKDDKGNKESKIKRHISEKAEKGRSLILGDKKLTFIVAAGILGIILIFFSGTLTKKESGTGEEIKTQDSSALAKEMEGRLGEILSSIDGVGNCKIMLTLENGYEYIYATDSKNTADRLQQGGDSDNKLQEKLSSDNKLILIDSSSGGKEGLLLKEIEPKVRGVVVVCEGGDSPQTQSDIIYSVSTALGISSTQIFVTKISSLE